MTTKQMSKTPSEMLHNLPPSPIKPMKTASVKGTLISHANAVRPPTIRLTGDDWGHFRWLVDNDGNATTGFTSDPIPGSCPRTLDIARVDNNQLCFDDLLEALQAVDAAKGKRLAFGPANNTVTTQVLHFPDPPDPKKVAPPTVKCADVVWYRYANIVDLVGDEKTVPERVAAGYAYGLPPEPASPTKKYEYKVYGLWLRYTFEYVMPEFGFVYGLNVPDSPDMLNPTASASLEIWLNTGEAGCNDGMGAKDINGPNGWVVWEPSDLTTTLTLASALRKHLWSAKGNHVFVHVDDDAHKERISQIIIPS